MDWFSCWHTESILSYRCSRGYSKWDEDEDEAIRRAMLSSPGLSQDFVTSFSMNDIIVQSDRLLILDDTLLPLLGSDSHFQKVYEFLCSEKCYLDEMCSALVVYAEPLRKMKSLAPEEVRILFSDLELLIYCSRDLCTRLRSAITKWERNSKQIGHLFNDAFWNMYEAYSSHYVHISRLVVSKRSTDTEFAEFCHRMESLGKPSLDSLLNMPMKRMASCANELKEMASDLDGNNPDVPLLVQTAKEAANRLVKSRKSDGNENYLKLIQEHFPQDDLHLMDKDVQSSPGNRWRWLAAKSLIGGGLKKSSMLGGLSPAGRISSPDSKYPAPEQQLILNSTAKLVVGIHSRERYLFLCNAFLIIAKGRFDTNFRLKNRITTSSLWVTPFSEKALIIGWPMQNSTFVFESSYLRDLWLASLKEVIRTEKGKELPQSMRIKIVKKDCEYTAIKSLLVSNHETASHVVERCLDEFHILDAVVADFQLCVASAVNETTFSLSGHEYPFTIWMNSSQVSADGSSDARIQFILRKSKKSTQRQIIGENSKPVKKVQALKQLFKKPPAKQGHRKLFGRKLSELFEQDTSIPYPVMQMLRKLYVDGPHTDGLFRKSANHAKLLAVKQSLDCGESVNFDEIPVPLIAVLLKEFLRNLPNCLLNCQMYHEWMRVVSIPSHDEQISSLKRLVQMLPSCNQQLLRHLMCVLCNLAKHSNECKMNAYNLSICVGQSLLWPDASVVQKEAAHNANIIVQKMIDFATDIFGRDCLTLLNDADAIVRPTQVVLRGISADSGLVQRTGAAEDLVFSSQDLEFNHSCGETDYSPVATDKVSFKMQSSQSFDSGLQLGDEVQECRDISSTLKIPLPAKMKYFTSSESREEEEEEEEEDCTQFMPNKLRHSKKKPTPGFPVLQQSSSVDILSPVQSSESLCVLSIESPLNESAELQHDQSSLSFSNVLPTESSMQSFDPPSFVESSTRMLSYQSMLQPPPVHSFSTALDQSVNVLLTHNSIKTQKRMSTNDSGVSFLGSLNSNSEDSSDTEYGRDTGSSFLFLQSNKLPAVDDSLENVSLAPLPCIRRHQFDQWRCHPPPLSELYGHTFTEKCLDMPEELTENKRDDSTSSGSSLLTTNGSSSDSSDCISDKCCYSTCWNQNQSYPLSSEHSRPVACTKRLAEEERKIRRQDPLPRRPLIRANAVESDPEKLKEGMTAEGSDLFPSQIKNFMNQSNAIDDKQPLLNNHFSNDSVTEKFAPMTSVFNTTFNRREMTKQNSSEKMTNHGHPICEKIMLEKIEGASHHDKPSERHSPSSMREFSKESLVMKQVIPHCKSLENVLLGADSENVVLLVQNNSQSHGSLLTNETRTQDMRVQTSTEMNCFKLSKFEDISKSLYKVGRPLVLDNKIDKAPAIAFKSKHFSELRSYYDRYEKTGDLLKSTNVVSEIFSSSDQNIRPRLSKKHSKARYLRKRGSDPRLNVEGKRGSDLGRSKSDSSEHYRNSKLMLQVSSGGRSEVRTSEEKFTSLENILLQKKIESCGKSMSAKDLSASVRNVNHHNENVKRKSVAIKDRVWHKELARHYIQSSSSHVNLSSSRKSDSSSVTCRFGREVGESFHRCATDSHECTGVGGDLVSLYTGKTRKAGGICFNDRLAGDMFGGGYKVMSHHASTLLQKTSLISSGLTSSAAAESSHPNTTEASHLKLSNTSVRELRENLLGLPLNSDASKASDNCSKTYVSSISGDDSLISNGSGQSVCDAVDRIMDDAKLLDPANISWSVARLKKLYSSQYQQSANRNTQTSHSKSEDWCSSKKTSALPRLG